MTGAAPDEDTSLVISKAARSLHNLVEKQKHREKGQDRIMKEESEYLESINFHIKGKKRKNFEDVEKQTQDRRIKSVIEQIETNPGLDEAVFETLKVKKESEDCDR